MGRLGIFTLVLTGVYIGARAHGHDAPTSISATAPVAATDLPSILHTTALAATHNATTLMSSINMDGAYEPTSSYFAYPRFGGLMFAHVAFMIFAWVFILPIGVILSISRSRIALPVQFVFLTLHSIATVLGTIYGHKTPDLYENNIHSKLGWVITWLFVGQIVLSIIRLIAPSRRKLGWQSSRQAIAADSSASNDEHGQYDRCDHSVPSTYRDSSSSERSRNSINTRSMFTSAIRVAPRSSDSTSPPHIYTQYKQRQLSEAEPKNSPIENEIGDEEEWEYTSMLPNRSNHRNLIGRARNARRFWRNLVSKYAVPMMRMIGIMHDMVDRVIMILGFTAIVSGAAVYAGVWRGSGIFNGLAHAIKGGVFFWYGLFTLGRWTGCFAAWGWAWNIKPARDRNSSKCTGQWEMPSAEFVESFLIFIYGSTNIFLEHLAAWGSAWTAQDLEHLAITIMFLGGGLCGMILELRPLSPGPTSTNVIPALIILILGRLMSSHHQHSPFSAALHAQWGTLLSCAAICRILTYILIFLRPAPALASDATGSATVTATASESKSKSTSPPPTELLTSFCLIAGGTIFMLSNRDSVSAMERAQVGVMLAFTLAVGVVLVIMGWVIVVLGLRSLTLIPNLPVPRQERESSDVTVQSSDI